jgi:hypothetical protein
VIKSGRIGWTGHAARIGINEKVVEFGRNASMKRVHAGELEVDGRIVSYWIFEKRAVMSGTELKWLKIGSNSGPL